MTKERQEEIRLGLIDLEEGRLDKVEVAEYDFSVTYSVGGFDLKGIKNPLPQDVNKRAKFVVDVLKIVDHFIFIDSLTEQEKLQRLFFKECNARIEDGIIVHLVWRQKVGGDSIRDGVDGFSSRWEPMTEEEVEKWAKAHNTTFRELFI